MTDQVNEAVANAMSDKQIMFTALCRIALGQGEPQAIADEAIAASRKAAIAENATHPARGVADEAFIVKLAEEAYRVHSSTRVGPYPNDSHAPKWQAVVRMVIDALAAQAAQPAVPSVSEGFVLAPHYRGYAKLGSGGYFLYHSGKGELAELVIVPATDSDREGRTVGDLSYDGPDEIPAENIAVRLRFDNVAGLDALEQQLRLLRDEHFAATPKDQP